MYPRYKIANQATQISNIIRIRAQISNIIFLWVLILIYVFEKFNRGEELYPVQNLHYLDLGSVGKPVQIAAGGHHTCVLFEQGMQISK